MIEHIILRDTRIGTFVQSHDNNRVINANPSTQVLELALRVRSAFKENSNTAIPRLTIIAHGAPMTRPLNRINGYSDFSIQLGEGITPNNATAFGNSIRGLISDRVRMMVCMPLAYNGGIAICHSIAISSGVPVYASSSIQNFHYGQSYLAELTNNRVGNVGPINFGEWEGPVSIITPTGEQRVLFEGPPASTGH